MSRLSVAAQGIIFRARQSASPDTQSPKAETSAVSNSRILNWLCWQEFSGTNLQLWESRKHTLRLKSSNYERMTEKYLELPSLSYIVHLFSTCPKSTNSETEFTALTSSNCNDTNVQHPWRSSKPIWLPQHLESFGIHQGWKRTTLQRHYNILPQQIMPFCKVQKRSNSRVRTCDQQNMAKWMNQRYLIVKERTPLLFLCPFYTTFNSH